VYTRTHAHTHSLSLPLSLSLSFSISLSHTRTHTRWKDKHTCTHTSTHILEKYRDTSKHSGVDAYAPLERACRPEQTSAWTRMQAQHQFWVATTRAECQPAEYDQGFARLRLRLTGALNLVCAGPSLVTGP